MILSDKKENKLNSEKILLEEKLENCNNLNIDLQTKFEDMTFENEKVNSNLDTIQKAHFQEINEINRKRDLEHEDFKSNITSYMIKGGIRDYLNSFENKISGGIIGKMKENFNNDYQNEIRKFHNFKKEFKGGSVQKGGMPIVMMAISALKISLMTVGSLFFNWWPIMMIVSFYCVYVEYKMTTLSGKDLMGMPILIILCAYLCPCPWALYRTIVGFSTTTGSSPKLFNIFSKCSSDGMTLKFDSYYGRECKDNKCLYTTDSCYKTLFNGTQN